MVIARNMTERFRCIHKVRILHLVSPMGTVLICMTLISMLVGCEDNAANEGLSPALQTGILPSNCSEISIIGKANDQVFLAARLGDGEANRVCTIAIYDVILSNSNVTGPVLQFPARSGPLSADERYVSWISPDGDVVKVTERGADEVFDAYATEEDEDIYRLRTVNGLLAIGLVSASSTTRVVVLDLQTRSTVTSIDLGLSQAWHLSDNWLAVGIATPVFDRGISGYKVLLHNLIDDRRIEVTQAMAVVTRLGLAFDNEREVLYWQEHIRASGRSDQPPAVLKRFDLTRAEIETVDHQFDQGMSFQTPFGALISPFEFKIADDARAGRLVGHVFSGTPIRGHLAIFLRTETGDLLEFGKTPPLAPNQEIPDGYLVPTLLKDHMVWISDGPKLVGYSFSSKGTFEIPLLSE